VWLLDRYSSAYASNQYRALQQFFKWLAAQEEVSDPMAGLKPPRVPDKPVPVFAAGDLQRLERACAGRAFAERRDAALIAVFRATGIRLSELAGIRYDADDPGRSDVDLWHREITVQGKGGKTRTVKISFDAARCLDRYLRVRARHAQGYRPQLWPGVGNRGAHDSQRDLPGHRPAWPPVRHRRVPAPVPAPLQPYLARPWRCRGRPVGAQRLDLPADAPPLRRQRPQRASPPQLRPRHGGNALT
jgi:integrase